MKSYRNLRTCLTLVCVSLLTAACGSSAEIDQCVERAWKPGVGTQGFELVNVASGEVWLTREWSVEEFEKFELPFSQFLWVKNDPRVGAAQSGKFLRSPGCEPDEFTYMEAHGRKFLHVVDLIDLGDDLDEEGLVRAIQLNKHHSVVYDEGKAVEILTDPSGQRFILVAKTLLEVADDPTVPEGWTLESFVLTEPFNVELDGKVTILRLDNEDSFQGPLPADMIIPTAP